MWARYAVYSLALLVVFLWLLSFLIRVAFLVFMFASHVLIVIAAVVIIIAIAEFVTKKIR